MTLAQEIKKRRLVLGDQADGARQLGISHRYMQKLEAGHAVPSPTVMKLLRILTTTAGGRIGQPAVPQEAATE